MISKTIGILTAGGDSPGLNAAIRGVGKVALSKYGMRLIGFPGWFPRFDAEPDDLAGTGRVERYSDAWRNNPGHQPRQAAQDACRRQNPQHDGCHGGELSRHDLDALVCVGGGGTAKNAWRLSQQGINVVCLPKTIDNDVSGTDVTFGFDTAMNIASEAIDRLQSTAHSHHRIIVCEIMGHNTGWLALGAGLAGGADVILIPEIPFNIEFVAESIRARSRGGTRFSIVAVSEGAMTQRIGNKLKDARARVDQAEADMADSADDKVRQKEARGRRKQARAELDEIEKERSGGTMLLTTELEKLTGLESRVTILGHVQRGGVPSPRDRLLATRLGTAAANFIADGQYNIMVGVCGEGTAAVPLGDVVGKRKNVPLDHPWLKTASDLEICLGDAI